MLKTLKRKIALVAVAGLGFGLVSTVPAFAAPTLGTDLTVGVKTGAADASLRILARDTTAGARVYDIFTQDNKVLLSDLTFTATATFATIATDTVPLVFTKTAIANGADLTAGGYNSLDMANTSRTGTNATAGGTVTGIGAATTATAGNAATSLANNDRLAATAPGSTAVYTVFLDVANGAGVVDRAATNEPKITLNVYDMNVGVENAGRWSQTATSVRTDDTSYNAVYGTGGGTDARIRVTAGAVNDFAGAQVSVTWKSTPTSSAVTISTVDAGANTGAGGTSTAALGTGVALVLNNVDTGTRALGKPTNGVYTIAGGVATANTPEQIDLRLGRNAVPGIYTLTVDSGATNDANSVLSKSITISDAPTAMYLDGAISETSAEETIGTGTTPNFNFYVTDAAGRRSYFLGTEKASMAVSGGSVVGKVTITTPVIPIIGSGSLTATATGQQVDVETTVAALAAGTYTITATASGFATTAITPAATTSTLKVISDALVSTAATKFTNATTGATGTNNLVNAVVYDDAKAAAGASVVATFLPVDQTKITLTATFPTTTTGDAKVTVTESDIPGVTVNTTLINAISAGSATFEYQATGTQANQTAVFALTADGTNVFEIRVTYAAAVVGKLTMTPIATGNSALVAPASTNDLTATVVDQFGRALPGVNVVFTVQAGSRGAIAANKVYSYTSNASGVAVLPLADAYTGTTLTTNTVVISVGGAVANQTVTLVYGTSVASTVTLAVAQPTTPGTTATYATDVTLATAPSVTVDTSLGATNNNTDALRLADQVAVVATVKDANGVVIRGQKVSITADAGVFLASATVAGVTAIAAADVDLAAATRKTTLDLYSDADGKVAFTAAFTKSGTAVKITATAGAATKAWSTKVVAGANAVVATKVTGSAVTTTVTDVWGNPVANAAVSLSVTGGLRFSNGFSSTSGNTAADGSLTTEVQGTGTGTVTATITGGDSAAVVSATYGTAAGVATIDAAVTGAALNAATDTAISAVKTDVKAVSDTVATLSKAVTTIQSSVTELTSSFATQIKSLTDAIAKISKAIAALSKKVSAKK